MENGSTPTLRTRPCSSLSHPSPHIRPRKLAWARLNKPPALKVSSRNWSSGARNSLSKGGGVLPITFKTGQALPLVVTRILRPRMSRGAGTEQPRNSSAQRPRQWPVREPDSATVRAQSRKSPEREQSAVAFCPRAQSWQRIVRVHEPATDQSGQDQANAMSAICPRSLRDGGMSASTSRPQPRADRESSSTRLPALHRLCVATAPPTEFPVHIHHAPTYDLI